MTSAGVPRPGRRSGRGKGRPTGRTGQVFGPPGPHPGGRRLRLAAYATIVRLHEGRLELLLTALADLGQGEQWTLPGGGVEFGEDPRRAVVREVHEEAGLEATVGEEAWVDDVFRPDDAGRGAYHSVRLVFHGWVPADSPEPHVVEVGGSTTDARWTDLEAIRAGEVPVVALVARAVAEHPVVRRQRLAAYALVLREADRPEVLLTRISEQGAHAGAWTLPGGGVEHGEQPERTVAREVAEETGLAVSGSMLLGVHDTHFTGRAPSGLTEDFHGVHLVYRCRVDGAGARGDEPRVQEDDGTTDAVAWVPLTDVEQGRVEVLDLVTWALAQGLAQEPAQDGAGHHTAG